MQAKKGNYWFMFKMLLLINVVLITVIILAHSNAKHCKNMKEPCSSAKKINADILNSVTVKLM